MPPLPGLGEMALTKKAVVYLALAYLFIGLALIFREPTLAAFVIPLAVVFFYSSLFMRNQKLDFRIQRILFPPRSFGGESIEVSVKLANKSQFGISDLYLEDSVPDELSIESGSRTALMTLRPNEEIDYSYVISAPKRGRYFLGPMKVRTADLFGFRQYSDTILGQDQVTILPKVEDLGIVELRARRVGPWPGSVPSKYLGAGAEFFELRQYSPGDELRRINWKASARQGRLVTNEYETERVTDVLVVLDCSEGVSSRLFAFDAEEFQVNLTASLCSQLLLQGNRVGLLVYGAERTWVAPAFGKRQLLRVLNGLAIVKAGRALVPIRYAVETIVSAVLSTRSVIVFVSPFVDNEIVEVVRDTAAEGYSVICFTPTAKEFGKEESQAELLAKRILATERRINMRRASLASAVHRSLTQCVPQSASSEKNAMETSLDSYISRWRGLQAFAICWLVLTSSFIAISLPFSLLFLAVPILLLGVISGAVAVLLWPSVVVNICAAGFGLLVLLTADDSDDVTDDC